MKMKKACETTALTERAIRLYLSKGLIAPKRTNGILDFSEDDIRRLKDIALLRQLDFTLEQLAGMIHQPQTIAEVIRSRRESAQSEARHSAEVCAALTDIDGAAADSIHGLAAMLRARSAGFPSPDFGRFDEISDADRQREKSHAFAQLARGEKRARRVRGFAAVLCVLTVCLLLAGWFLARPKVRGYVQITPFTITELRGDAATITIGNERTAELLGRDTITVAYRAHGVPLAAGDTIDSGCQLAIEITNGDLLRMGISPFQTMQTSSEEINSAWMRLVIRQLFARPLRGEAMLWIREYNPQQLPPLFWWEAE